MLTLERLMDEINVKNYPSEWKDMFDSACRVCESKALEFLDDTYLDRLNDMYDAFPRYLKVLKEAASQIRKDDRLYIYTALISETMENRVDIGVRIKNTDMPSESDGKYSPGYDLAAIFPFFRFADRMAAELTRRNVPREIILSSIRTFENFIHEKVPFIGRPLMSKTYLSWGQQFVDLNIIRIKRFNLEFLSENFINAKVYRNSAGDEITLVDGVMIHRSGNALGSTGFEDEEGSYLAEILETDEYYEGYPTNSDGICAQDKVQLNKNEWTAVLTKNDKAISVHIPSFESLAPDYCTESLLYADKILKDCFSEFDFKAYVCHSWMLEPQLREILPEESKLVSFQKRFSVIPTKSDDKAIIHHAFDRKPNYDYEKLNPKTSLERAIKAHYLAGKHLYEYSGYFFI